MKKILFSILLILICLVSLSSADAICGNGVIDAGEQCDGTNLGGATCATLGSTYPNAILGCYPAGSDFECMFNAVACNSYPNVIPCLSDLQCAAGWSCDTTSNNYYCVGGGNGGNQGNSLAFTFSDSAGNDITELLISGQEDQTVTATLYVKNTGDENLSFTSNDFSYDPAKFTKNDREIKLSFENIPANIAVGTKNSLTVKAVIPNNMDIDTYSGDLTLTISGISDTIKLKVQVQPEVCEEGEVGDLSIEIKEPDSGDEFAPGDSIGLEIKVVNDADEDLEDIVVEAFLYNLDEDDEIVREETEPEDIDENDDKVFELELVVPDDEDLDEDDEYIIYIKAYEDGNEDEHCSQDSVKIDIEREKYDVVIKRFDVRPSFVKAGELVSFEVTVENQGTKDIDDVYVEVKESSLDIGERSEEFELKDYKDEDDNDATKRFTFTIPEDAKTGDYMVEAIVYYKDADKSDSEFVTLKIGGVEEEVGVGIKLSLTTTTTGFDVNEDKGKLHLVITNNEDKDLTGTLEVNPIGTWASQVSQSVSLHKGDNNLYLEIPLSAKETGKQSANVVVRVDGYEAKQFTLNFDITGEKRGKLSEALGSTTLLVIGYVVLVLIGLYFLKLIFSRPKSKSLI